MSSNLASSPRLLTRSQYRSCHIRLPDSDQVSAAIYVDCCYYSFFKVADAATADKLIDRLQQRGDSIVLTQTPKGFAIWVLELDAQPLRKRLPFRILTTSTQYRHCQIRVPDLAQNLDAIEFEHSYYSLFRSIEDIQQALPIIDKLSDRGDEIIITKTQEGYSLWILEADGWAIE